jgi:ElaB/YqjD/DUF883 family membrane-anchored ribosome-binding protein
MTVSDEFKKIISDFVADIATVFPEHSEACATVYNMDPAAVYDHCKLTYAPQFFNILYRNDTVLFAEPIELLPGLDFKALWETPDVSDATKEAVWKYLQLVMFSVVSDLSDTSTFGDAAKLFEAIDESVLKSKLEEVMQQMQDMFKDEGTSAAGTSDKSAAGSGEAGSGEAGSCEAGSGASEANGFSFPPGMDPNSMHEHLSGLLGGKIGNLAKEIAEETAAELNLDTSDEASVQSVFQNLFKNPGKLMGIVKNVGQKLDAKMKSGEIKESEIMQEASELMSKMKKMPGINNVADLLKKMGMEGGMGGMDIGKMAASMGLGGKNAKFNMGAMQSHLNQNMKTAKTKERMQQKLEERRAAMVLQAQAAVQQAQPLVFSTGEKVERTPRFPQSAATGSAATGLSTGSASAATSDAPAPDTQSNKKKKTKK